MSNFLFDGTSSHLFGLVIGHIGNTGVESISTYSNIELVQDRSLNRIEPYHYGIKYPERLEFPMEIYNKHGEHYEMYEVQAIQEWLFGRNQAKYLSILDPDKGGEAYLCWLTSPEIIKLDNKVIGWKFTVVTHSCYSHTNIYEESFVSDDDFSISHFHNMSNVEDYLYPEMEIHLQGLTTFVRIENISDNSRVFQITNLRRNSIVTVNNDLHLMSANNPDDIFENFNLNWFRFVPGHNRLLISGGCVVTFRTRFMKAVGGF